MDICNDTRNASDSSQHCDSNFDSIHIGRSLDDQHHQHRTRPAPVLEQYVAYGQGKITRAGAQKKV